MVILFLDIMYLALVDNHHRKVQSSVGWVSAEGSLVGRCMLQKELLKPQVNICLASCTSLRLEVKGGDGPVYGRQRRGHTKLDLEGSSGVSRKAEQLR
jgi:hypothetical protein